MLEVKARDGWAHARDRPTRCAAVRRHRAVTVAAPGTGRAPTAVTRGPPVAATSPVPPRGIPEWWSVMRELGQIRIEEHSGETAAGPGDDRDDPPVVVPAQDRERSSAALEIPPGEAPLDDAPPDDTAPDDAEPPAEPPP